MHKLINLACLCIILVLSSFSNGLAESQRQTPNRAQADWREVVQQRQQAYQTNPRAEAFTKRAITSQLLTPLNSHNEASPVSGVITEWWCSSNGVADYWDDMWMALIAETVKTGATAYVYLYSYLGHDDVTTLQACSEMLEAKEGIAMGQVEWIQDFATDAFWLRDFGPFFVSHESTNELSIEDAKYYPGRVFDDAQPKDFANRYNYPISDLDLFYEGGNFLPNGGGICIASSVLLGVNPQYTEQEIAEMFKSELGCDNLTIVQALNDAATGHVDMWLAWANQTTLLVGEYTQKQDPVNHAIIESNITEILSKLVDPKTGEAIQIIRVPMPSNCPPQYAFTGQGEYKIQPKVAPQCGKLPANKRIWRTYLNVTLINDTVVLPVYLQDQTFEAEVIALWQSLGFNVRPVVADHITPYQGQFHCITKTIPDLI